MSFGFFGGFVRCGTGSQGDSLRLHKMMKSLLKTVILRCSYAATARWRNDLRRIKRSAIRRRNHPVRPAGGLRASRLIRPTSATAAVADRNVRPRPKRRPVRVGGRRATIPFMSEVLDIAAVAALVGDPARANILCALLDGRALAAGELAYAARVSPQTTSGHLAKLAAAQLITSSPQGRHRYFRLAGPHVAAMLESIMAVAAIAPPRCRPVRIADDMRTARMCYDHVAGRLGVGLADALRARDHVEFSDDGGVLTPSGEVFLREFGIDIEAARHSKRILLPPLHRLERTAASSRRRGRRRARRAPPGSRLGRARARRTDPRHHADGAPQSGTHIRCRVARRARDGGSPVGGRAGVTAVSRMILDRIRCNCTDSLGRGRACCIARRRPSDSSKSPPAALRTSPRLRRLPASAPER